jgi:hypothetical protein
LAGRLDRRGPGCPVRVNDLEGFALSTYLVHVVMHGVESFSAAAILLHRAGHSVGEAGFLDYIDWTRTIRRV